MPELEVFNDVKIEFLEHSTGLLGSKDANLFYCWFHTAFVSAENLIYDKESLDKSKKMPDGAELRLTFARDPHWVCPVQFPPGCGLVASPHDLGMVQHHQELDHAQYDHDVFQERQRQQMQQASPQYQEQYQQYEQKVQPAQVNSNRRIAQYDYAAADTGQLSFRAGAAIEIVQGDDPKGWLCGRIVGDPSGTVGWFPGVYTVPEVTHARRQSRVALQPSEMDRSAKLEQLRMAL